MKLNAQHQKAIILLSEGLNNKEVAERLGLASETISRYKSDFDFQAALNAELAANREAQRDKLRSLTSEALNSIQSVLTDESAPHKEKLTAAFKILDLTGLKHQDIGSIDSTVLKRKSANAKLFEELSL